MVGKYEIYYTWILWGGTTLLNNPLVLDVICWVVRTYPTKIAWEKVMQFPPMSSMVGSFQTFKINVKHTSCLVPTVIHTSCDFEIHNPHIISMSSMTTVSQGWIFQVFFSARKSLWFAVLIQENRICRRIRQGHFGWIKLLPPGSFT